MLSKAKMLTDLFEELSKEVKRLRMEWMSFLLLYAYIHNDSQHKNICLTSEEDSTQSQIEMGLFEWLLMSCQAAVNIDNDGSTQTHRGLRSVPCQRPSQDVCQQKKAVLATTSSLRVRGRQEAIFERIPPRRIAAL